MTARRRAALFFATFIVSSAVMVWLSISWGPVPIGAAFLTGVLTDIGYDLASPRSEET